jgi:DNA-binding transcriptional regulator LsrR (DeoR family)
MGVAESENRGGDGRYARSLETVERDVEAARLRSQGRTYQQIADQLGVSKPAAYKMVQRAMADVDKEPAEAAVAFELEKLDVMEADITERLGKRHLVVSVGKVVNVNGEPLEDDDFALRAQALLLKVAERRAKLMGLDSATKLDVSGGMTYQLIGADDV